MIDIKPRAISLVLLSSAFLAPLMLSACAVGPNYKRPAAPISQAFKQDQGWKPATPSEPASDTDWWSIYNDPVLHGLEKELNISNQNLKQSEAAYRAARAAVDEARGSLLPSIDVNGSGSESFSHGSFGISTGAGGVIQTGQTGKPRRTYQANAQASWDFDLWGRIRRNIEASAANAQASAADLAGARLSAQATLAQDYFQLRAADEEKRLLQQSIKDFQDALQIAKNRFAVGVASEADVYEAQTQVDSAVAQSVGVDLTRAQLEDALAVLVGKAPADFSLAAAAMPTAVPIVPAGLPSSLLERRPDIAAAERKTKAANAQVGIAIAAWFPDVTLSGSRGFASSVLSTLINSSNEEWSFGASVGETIFNGGARLAQTSEARAAYDEAVASYRQTVLSGLQQVEDDLAASRVLEQQAAAENTTVQDARKSEALTTNQYKAGISDYSSVITAETARLNAEISALNLLSQRLVASADLVTALGGGWHASDLPHQGPLLGMASAKQAKAVP